MFNNLSMLAEVASKQDHVLDEEESDDGANNRIATRKTETPRRLDIDSNPINNAYQKLLKKRGNKKRTKRRKKITKKRKKQKKHKKSIRGKK